VTSSLIGELPVGVRTGTRAAGPGGERTIVQPEAPIAITGYQEALDAMAQALDRYQARKLPLPTVDASS